MTTTHASFSRRHHSRISRGATVTPVVLFALVVSIWIMPSQLAAINIPKVSALGSKCNSGIQKACRELAEIAVRDKRPVVRTAAVEGLSDQPTLASIALRGKDASVRSAAVAKLTDPSLLAKVALEATDANVRGAASRLTDQIHDAARDGDLAKVQALLKGNPELVFGKGTHGGTRLHWAALKGHADVAELLLANHADVNARANSARTPLYLAALKGHKDVTELLFANHADVNAKDNDGHE
jgi:hypothetical protein